MDGDWRVPNEYERELIAKWRRNSTREDLRSLIIPVLMMIALFAVGIIAIVYAVLTGSLISDKFLSALYDKLPVFIIGLVIIIFLFILFLHALRKQKSDDYQIQDAVVIYRLQTDKFENILTVRTSAGEDMEISVPNRVFKVAKLDTPGFVLRYNSDDPAKKAGGILSKSLVLISEYQYCPGIRVEDEKE